MQKKNSKGKKLFTTLSFILIISFALISVSQKLRGNPTFFQSAITTLIFPFQTFFNSTIQKTEDLFENYIFLTNVSQENETLKKEIEKLENQRNKLIEDIFQLQREYNILQRPTKSNRKSIMASVIGKDSGQWLKTVIIDKGTDAGLVKNSATITDRGIVGQVIEANPKSSKILLISDNRSAVDAIFQRSRSPGVVFGAGKQMCKMRFVSMEADVKEGDKIISSGMGGVFPKGLTIGSVRKIIKKKQGLFQEIEVVPSVDLSRLEEMLVLLPD